MRWLYWCGAGVAVFAAFVVGSRWWIKFVRRPLLSFDNSGANELARDSERAALLAGIKSGYFTRLPVTCVEEALATKDEAIREKLFDTLCLLLRNGECLYDHNVLTNMFVQNYEKYGSSLWNSLNIRFTECESAIVRRDFPTTLPEQQRQFGHDSEEQFKILFGRAQPEFEKIFAAGTERPRNADELVAKLSESGGALWQVGMDFYARCAGYLPTEEKIRAFARDCVPFMALLLGPIHAQFEWCITDAPAKKKKRVGRVDTLSAIFLPYCDVYVTNDEEQQKCLTQIAAFLNLPVEVVSYAEFKKGLTSGGAYHAYSSSRKSWLFPLFG